MSDFPIVEVHWMDASCQSDEVTIDDLPELIPVRTVGRLLKRSEEAIWVAAEWLAPDKISNKDHFRSTTVIPVAWLTRPVRRLK